MSKIKYTFIIAFIIYSSILRALDIHENLVFENFNKIKELKGQTTEVIYQDKNGFMWFGTWFSGLIRFDGYSVKTYKPSQEDKNSILGIEVSCIFEDSNNDLWVGTQNAICIYHPKSDKFESHRNSQNKLFQVKGRIVGFLEDENRNIWIATVENGLYRYNLDNKTLTKFNFPIKDKVRGICAKGKKIWILCSQSIFFKDDQTQNIILYKSWKNNKQFKAHCITKNNMNLLIGTDDGLITINDKEEQLFYNSIKKIHAITVQNDSLLWMALDGKGISIFDIKNNDYTVITTANGIGLETNNIISTFLDTHQNIWVGTYLHGLYITADRINSISHIFHNPKTTTSIDYGPVSSFFEDENKGIWIGIDGNGINHIKGGKVIERFTKDHKENNRPKKVMGVFYDKKRKTQWWSTFGDGVYKYQNKKFTHYFPHKNKDFVLNAENYHDVRVINDEIFFLSFWNGFKCFNIDTKKEIHYYKKGELLSEITTVIANDDDFIYVGGLDGISKISLSNKFITNFQPSKKKNSHSNFITSIIPVSPQLVYIGTHQGIYTLEENNIKPLPNKELSNVFVNAMELDNDGNLWISGDHSLFEYQPSNKSIHEFPLNEKFGVYAFVHNSSMKDSKGQLYFGSNNGYLKFNPKLLKEHSLQPKTYLIDFKSWDRKKEAFAKVKSNHKNILFSDTIILNYYNNNFEFKLASLNFIDTEHNLFSYRLKGYENRWKVSQNNQSSYTNLTPGTYILQIKSAAKGKNWTKNPREIIIIIPAPFWHTIWFFLLVTFSLIALIILYIRYKIHSVKQQNFILERKVKERTKELRKKNLIIEEKHKLIESSINYASILQSSVLGLKHKFFKRSPYNGFILYKPKDKVSGDFYWQFDNENYNIIIAADCTGHGVPGALMTVLGKTILDNYVNSHPNDSSAAGIITNLEENLKKQLSDKDGRLISQDGMDMTILFLNKKNNRLEFCGLNNPLYLIQEGELKYIKASKFFIGGSSDFKKTFEIIHLGNLKKGTTLYLSSDGYQDQFSEDDIKFMRNRFKKTLLEASKLDINLQEQYLNNTIENWKGSTPQTDDILIIGVQIP